MNKNLMKYIPKEYKKLVVDIYEANGMIWNENTKKYNRELVVEWENGESTIFQNKSFAWHVLKEFHTPDEYKLNA